MGQKQQLIDHRIEIGDLIPLLNENDVRVLNTRTKYNYCSRCCSCCCFVAIVEVAVSYIAVVDVVVVADDDVDNMEHFCKATTITRRAMEHCL